MLLLCATIWVEFYTWMSKFTSRVSLEIKSLFLLSEQWKLEYSYVYKLCNVWQLAVAISQPITE